MVARERAQAVRREKLVFVEDAGEHPLETVGRDDCEHASSVGGACERARELRLLSLESVERISERCEALELLGADLHSREQRDESDGRADAQHRGRAVGETKPVVVEAVALIPELVDRARNDREVSRQSGGEPRVCRVALGQHERNLEQVEAVPRHPAGRVRLLEHLARR